MSQFAILRTANIKDRAQLRAAQRHNATPEGRPPNADPGRGGVEVVAGHENAEAALDALIDQHSLTIRKSGTVLAVEFVTSFSPESPPSDLEQWKRDNVEFFANKYGEENMLQATLHTDETTPHMHFLIAPVVQKVQYNKERMVLSATDLVGGKKAEAREKLQKLHDEYADAMSPHGLERGIRNSKAHHKTIKRWYAEQQWLDEQYQPPADKKENIKGIKPTRVGMFKDKVKALTFDKLAERFNQAKELYNEYFHKYRDENKSVQKLKAVIRTLESQLDKERYLKDQLIQGKVNPALVEKSQELTQENAELKADNQGLRHHIEQQHQAHAEEIEEIRHDHAQEIESWRLGLGGKPIDQVPEMWLERARERAADRERIQARRPDGP